MNSSHREKVKRGEVIYKVPFGYRQIWEGPKRKVIIIEEEKIIVQDLYEKYSKGTYSLNDLSKYIQKTYTIFMGRNWVSNILSNHFYNGYITYNKSLYKHDYPLFIDESLFNKVQEVRAERPTVRKTYNSHAYLYKKLMRCAHCSCLITAEKQKGFIYYHCTNSSRVKHKPEWLREEEITHQLTPLFNEADVASFITHYTDIMYHFLSTATESLFLKDRHLIINRSLKSLKEVGEECHALLDKKLFPEKSVSFTNPILNACVQPKSMDELCSLLGRSHADISNELIDLELDDLIEQTMNGTWKTII